MVNMKMEKFKRVIKTFLKRPKSITRIINWEEEMQQRVFKKYSLYHGLSVKSIFSVSPKIRDVVVSPYVFSYGSALSIEIAMLKAIAIEKGDCRFLEIGTYKGETAANLAEVCNDVVTMDISSEDHVGIWSKKYPNIKQIIADSLKFDWSMLGLFDLIFIDGNHGYYAVVSDTQNAFKVLAPGGIIVWHDYIMRFDKVLDYEGHIRWEVLCGILDGTPEELRSNLYHVNQTMSAIFCNKELDNSEEDYSFGVRFE